MSTQEIDLTAGTDSHPNDPHMATPGRVRQVAVPPAARALSTFSYADHVDAFLVETGPAQDRRGEQWARPILEDAPITMRRALWWGGLRSACSWVPLGPTGTRGPQLRGSIRSSRSLAPAPPRAAGRRIRE